jgi:hypothetical protein
MRRAENNIPDMIARYQGLLQNVGDLSENLQARPTTGSAGAMVKTNAAKDAVAYLEKARTLRPDAYRKHAGILLALGYFAAQDAAKLAAEINLAIDGKYDSDIPEQILQWSGMQSYNAGDYAIAAKCLGLIANPEEPRATPRKSGATSPRPASKPATPKARSPPPMEPAGFLAAQRAFDDQAGDGDQVAQFQDVGLTRWPQ